MTSPHGDGAMEQKLAAAHHEAMEEDDMMPVMLDEGEVLEVLDDGDEVDEISHALDGDALDIEDGEDEDGDGGTHEEGEEEEPEVTELLVDNSDARFTGHAAPVFSVSIHPAGELAVSGGEDDCAFVWRMADGSLVHTLEKHLDSVVCTGFNRDGKLVAIGSMDGIIKVYKVEDGTKVCELDCGDDLNWFEWHPVAQFILAGTGSGSMYMWDVPGANQSFFSGQTMSASCGGWAPDGRNFVSGSEDGSLVLWSPKSGEIIARVNDGENGPRLWGPLTAAAWSPMGGKVVVGTAGGTVNLVMAKEGKVVSTFHLGEEASVESVALSDKEPQKLAAGTMEGRVHVIDVASQREVHVLEHSHGVVKVEFLHSRQALVASTLGGTAHLWNCVTGECEQTFSCASTTHVLDFAVDKTESNVVTCGEDGVCRVYTIAPAE